MQVSEHRWVYDDGFPGRLPRHGMTDLACTYPILNGLILNGFRAMLTRDQRLPSMDEQNLAADNLFIHQIFDECKRAVLT